MRTIKFMGILIFALCAFVGCSKPIDRTMVIGKYIANHNKGADIIEVKSDGTYIYYFNAADGKILSNTNRWSFEIENNEPRITFEKFIFGLPGYGIKKPGFWDVEVEKSGESFRLSLDPDLNYYYEMKK